MELVNAPVAEPSLVLVVNAIVGFVVVPQQTPRAVTADPPSFVILPPLEAVVEVIADTTVVVKTGANARVVNDV